MIISKTGFRISFFGGGSDYPVYYHDNPGSVLSTTIDKYCYIQTRYYPNIFDYKYRLRYHIREEINNIDNIVHPSVRECIKFMKIDKGLEMVHTSDIPNRTGMGSSSAFTVGFLNSLYALKGEIISKRLLAEDAINIEQNIIREHVGSQDQIATAFGGFNRIDFGGEHEFDIHPITISKRKIDNLQNHLMLFFTGYSRTSSDIAKEQIKKTLEKKNEINRMVEMVDEAIDILNGNDIDDFGRLLHESWILKRSLTDKISTPDIDNIYKSAIDVGALGGKLLGAGGGGCILLFVKPEDQNNIRNKLKNLIEIPFKFENDGSKIIYKE